MQSSEIRRKPTVRGYLGSLVAQRLRRGDGNTADGVVSRWGQGGDGHDTMGKLPQARYSLANSVDYAERP